ncbi:MAG: WbqC family protein [Terriglobales bacterium]
MKLAIMQPYFFPYLGYFQLIGAVDKFVFYDDVNFIKNGWINRNRLYLSGDVRYITVPLAGASPFEKINRVVIRQGDGWRRKILESVRHSYSKAPYFAAVNELLSSVLLSNEDRVGEVAKQSVRVVCDYLGLQRNFVQTSADYANDSLSGAARVLDICTREGARDYFNLPGGRALYDEDAFRNRGLALHFIQPSLNPYKQFSGEFCAGLSILDVLMFNSREAALSMICEQGQA